MPKLATTSREIRAIHSEADYESTLQEVEELWGAKPGTAAANRLEVLTVLIAAYEEANHPIDPPDPIDAILFRMEQQGLSRKDLEPCLGGRGRVSEVLARKRRLSIRMIRALHETLGISAGALIGPTIPAAKKRAR